MTKRNAVLLLSALLPCIIAILIGADLMGKFGNSDTAFAAAMSLYILYTFRKRLPSSVTFSIVILFVIGMGISYMMQGSERLTERFGEWFYLFFLFGLVQYFYETWNNTKK